MRITARQTSLTNRKTMMTEVITPNVKGLLTELKPWVAAWEKLPLEKKKAWIDGDKSLVLSLAYRLYVYLRGIFEEFDDQVQGQTIDTDTLEIKAKV